MSAVSVKNLRKSYKKQVVLDNLTFTIKKGSIFALLGSNGAGKTTTINILSTLVKPDSGEANIQGHDVVKDAKEVRKHLSLTGQYAAVDELLTGKENMYMMGRLSRVSPQTIKKRTAQLLKQFDLEKAADKAASTYSGGMRRKLDLAISLLASPSILFLDEPTTGLDPRSRQELWRLIKSLAHDGTTILLTTQYLDEADYLADEIAVLREGTIVAQGTSDDLKKHIGASYLELEFAQASDTQAAMKLIRDSSVSSEKPTLLIVPFSDEISEVRRLLNELANEGLEPKSLTIRKPTLDDVFMHLTDQGGNN